MTVFKYVKSRKVWYTCTKFSDGTAVSIFMVEESTWSQIPEGHNLNIHRRNNVKSYTWVHNRVSQQKNTT
jgi:hypothetical protein